MGQVKINLGEGMFFADFYFFWVLFFTTAWGAPKGPNPKGPSVRTECSDSLLKIPSVAKVNFKKGMFFWLFFVPPMFLFSHIRVHQK